MIKRVLQLRTHCPECPGAQQGGQTWATFVKNHANDIWCCDFVQTYDLLFRPLFLFFLLNQGSRRVVQ